MFDTLTDRLTGAVRRLSGQGRITESNIRETMDEVRTALLDADVNLEVVDTFCDEVRQEALGEEVLRSLRPGEQMVEIVHRRLVELMGPVDEHLVAADPGPTVIMVCGLQGTGKTTTCAKLAAWLRRNGRSVLVCAADLQRPAAVEQLRIGVEKVAESGKGQARVGFYGEPDKCAAYGEAVGVAVEVCQRAVKHARSERYDVLLVDTAGRLHIDEPLMKELRGVQFATQPHHILLVVDAMAGQDAVRSAAAFNEQLQIDGVILTKLDSDTRGGGALSVKHVTGVPIRFIGTGERFEDLEPFHPERMAGRILGMGDVVSLAERAREEVDEDEAEALAEKMAKGQFTMDDFLKQLRSLRRMGNMKQLLGMLPGVGRMLKNVDLDDGQFDRIEAMAGSMTSDERTDVSIMNKSRIRRVSRGSGTSGPEVNKLLKQFDMVRKMSQQMAGMGGRMQAAKAMSSGAMPDLAAMGRGSTKTKSAKTGFKRRKRK
ncbi:MAG: signal recognition particle protein [Planctomycetes bacterium]|nr:signal recognition particle protein [Planctomycetota bacterium]MCP4838711.1 signal recognition particle protein [Planctomycetota bacterium]